ncbi:hypothetical protein BU17DRAFT_63139 [Hysterangium stoloniferum]|nr:hypothetical protein BU17DRAFT_63139 [Hysterangium stoloniferum]
MGRKAKSPSLTLLGAINQSFCEFDMLGLLRAVSQTGGYEVEATDILNPGAGDVQGHIESYRQTCPSDWQTQKYSIFIIENYPSALDFDSMGALVEEVREDMTEFKKDDQVKT